MNKYRFNIQSNDKYLNIPIEIKTDMLGRDDLVDKYEDEVLEKVINPVEDFEVTRYAHNDWFKEDIVNTSIEYKFSFFDRNGEITDVSNSQSNYVNDYVFTENPNFTGTCFTEAEVYYFANSFKRSFFKLDLYDTPNSETQTLYLSIIIPTQQGETRSSNTDPIESNGQVDGPTITAINPQGGGARSASSSSDDDSSGGYDSSQSAPLPTTTPQVDESLSHQLSDDDCGLAPSGPQPSVPSSTPTPSVTPSVQSEGSGGDINDDPQGFGEGEDASPLTAPPNVEIKIPHFILDYIGDKEGYFIYWLKNPNYVTVDTFYMGAKFFNAKTGQFVRFLNKPQTNFSERFTFDKSEYFYYKVELDIQNYVYEVKDIPSNIRVGAGGAINWYEYVNPS